MPVMMSFVLPSHETLLSQASSQPRVPPAVAEFGKWRRQRNEDYATQHDRAAQIGLDNLHQHTENFQKVRVLSCVFSNFLEH